MTNEELLEKMKEDMKMRNFSKKMRIFVRKGKGDKKRYTILPHGKIAGVETFGISLRKL